MVRVCKTESLHLCEVETVMISRCEISRPPESSKFLNLVNLLNGWIKCIRPLAEEGTINMLPRLVQVPDACSLWFSRILFVHPCQN